jgi:hypothetical protein
MPIFSILFTTPTNEDRMYFERTRLQDIKILLIPATNKADAIKKFINMNNENHDIRLFILRFADVYSERNPYTDEGDQYVESIHAVNADAMDYGTYDLNIEDPKVGKFIKSNFDEIHYMLLNTDDAYFRIDEYQTNEYCNVKAAQR